MKRTLTALTVAATMFASSASAFELNTTYEEENKLQGMPTVGDLAVGVKGLLTPFFIGCNRNGILHLVSYRRLETDPSDYGSYLEIIRQADGKFTITYLAKEGADIPSMRTENCDEAAEKNPGATFYPVKSMNGFTDRRSFVIDLINKGYQSR